MNGIGRKMMQERIKHQEIGKTDKNPATIGDQVEDIGADDRIMGIKIGDGTQIKVEEPMDIEIKAIEEPMEKIGAQNRILDFHNKKDPIKNRWRKNLKKRRDSKRKMKEMNGEDGTEEGDHSKDNAKTTVGIQKTRRGVPRGTPRRICF